MKQSYYIALAVVLIVGILLFLSYVGVKTVPEDKRCENDGDCACGTNVIDGSCFYGNKNFVDEKWQCPDFCTGIANNFAIKCVNNECMQIRRL
jgi:hypothetical protein